MTRQVKRIKRKRRRELEAQRTLRSGKLLVRATFHTYWLFNWFAMRDQSAIFRYLPLVLSPIAG